MPQHPLTIGDTTFFRHAFLRNTSRRYALMLTPTEARRLDQKYDERCGAITDVVLAHHLTGEIALVAPTAVDGHAHLLPIDIDAGGIAAIRILIAHFKRQNNVEDLISSYGVRPARKKGFTSARFTRTTTRASRCIPPAASATSTVSASTMIALLLDTAGTTPSMSTVSARASHPKDALRKLNGRE